MLQPVNPLSSISLMKSIPLLKSLGSGSTEETKEKSKKDKLREKIEELEKKVEKKPDRIGGGSPQPVPDNGNTNPFEDGKNPFKVDKPNPLKIGDPPRKPQDLIPKCGDNVWKTTNGSQTHQTNWISRT